VLCNSTRRQTATKRGFPNLSRDTSYGSGTIIDTALHSTSIDQLEEVASSYHKTAGEVEDGPWISITGSPSSNTVVLATGKATNIINWNIKTWTWVSGLGAAARNKTTEQ